MPVFLHERLQIGYKFAFYVIFCVLELSICLRELFFGKVVIRGVVKSLTNVNNCPIEK